jgi:hypothetical protein
LAKKQAVANPEKPEPMTTTFFNFFFLFLTEKKDECLNIRNYLGTACLFRKPPSKSQMSLKPLCFYSKIFFSKAKLAFPRNVGKY